jgi:hypothetical protein
LDSAFSSWFGKAYVCFLAVWWTYRLIKYGGLGHLVGAVAIALQSAGFLVFNLESPTAGVVLILVGFGAWALVDKLAVRPSGGRAGNRG